MKILLVKFGHLGDTLLLTPTIDFLAKQFPNLRLDVMVRSGCEAMLQGHPAITNLIPIAAPEKNRRTTGKVLKEFTRAFRTVFARRYDYAFAFTESDRAAFWVSISLAKVRGANDAYGGLQQKRKFFNRISLFPWANEHQVLRDFRTVTDVLGVKAEPGALHFEPQIEFSELQKALPFLKEIKNYAVIHPASRWAFKQWLPERWAAVADELRRRHELAVIFSCGADEREKKMAGEILKRSREKHFNTDGKLSLRQLGRLLQGAKMFLGVDTVAMHLAAAMQTPTVALFGPSSEWSWHPWQCRHELVLGECTCKATRQFVCDKSKPYPCMERITVDAVLSAAGKLFSAK